MKKIIRFTTVVCFTSFLAVSAFGAPAAPDGKILFDTVCANCHGATGTGGKAPTLKGQPVAELTKKLDGYKAGTYGRGGKATMEGMVKKYSPADLEAAVKHIGTL